MERGKCVRCDGEMEYLGQKHMQLGEASYFGGHLSNLLSGSLCVNIYCCEGCKKLEFYAVDESARKFEMPKKDDFEGQEELPRQFL